MATNATVPEVRELKVRQLTQRSDGQYIELGPDDVEDGFLTGDIGDCLCTVILGNHDGEEHTKMLGLHASGGRSDGGKESAALGSCQKPKVLRIGKKTVWGNVRLNYDSANAVILRNGEVYEVVGVAGETVTFQDGNGDSHIARITNRQEAGKFRL